MKVFVVRAEHFEIPGLIIQAFDSQAKADAAIDTIVADMWTDHLKRGAFGVIGKRETTIERLDHLQGYYGSQFCYAEVAALDVA